jgi:dTDP-N-acetylfucosamine:lipid II N-acetylfucosaminyltransferase
MNYHLMINDKFTDSFMQDVYDIGEEHNNAFWVRGSINDAQHIGNEHKIEWVENAGQTAVSLNQKLRNGDRIYIHWFDLIAGAIASQIPSSVPVYAYLWGGDFFEDPEIYHVKWIHDRKTRKYVIRSLFYSTGYPASPMSFIKQPIRGISKIIRARKQFLLKKEYVRRINFLILHPANTGDFQLVQKMYSHYGVKHVPGFYDLNFDLAAKLDYKQPGSQLKLLVGNSATSTNNHIDAFDKIRRLSNVKVFCPLSYGADAYKAMVTKTGEKIFGDDFVPIHSFLTRQEYVGLMNEMDVVIMYHNRSQAFGNIVTALTLGKRVFLKKQNTLTGLLNNIGIPIYDAGTIDKIDLRDCAASADSRNHIAHALRQHFSKETRLSFLSEALRS